MGASLDRKCFIFGTFYFPYFTVRFSLSHRQIPNTSPVGQAEAVTSNRPGFPPKRMKTVILSHSCRSWTHRQGLAGSFAVLTNHGLTSGHVVQLFSFSPIEGDFEEKKHR